ncbi:hypothetical protein PLICRDRAFT_180585 [Plicaturopsis crispa FD-325 SS-3]|uniref:Chromo domain-containing protein n=1 Tax=Plicaturopsis crispa FD-325 SS-3 TaxID=944288 RepID=A0A0C9T1W3_PLICR|nr:hypothetical protein PLICRDRAFT_180585 [Plicaturopsis crispa FD-325 SS-3]
MPLTSIRLGRVVEESADGRLLVQWDGAIQDQDTDWIPGNPVLLASWRKKSRESPLTASAAIRPAERSPRRSASATSEDEGEATDDEDDADEDEDDEDDKDEDDEDDKDEDDEDDKEYQEEDDSSDSEYQDDDEDEVIASAKGGGRHRRKQSVKDKDVSKNGSVAENEPQQDLPRLVENMSLMCSSSNTERSTTMTPGRDEEALASSQLRKWLESLTQKELFKYTTKTNIRRANGNKPRQKSEAVDAILLAPTLPSKQDIQSVIDG